MYKCNPGIYLITACLLAMSSCASDQSSTGTELLEPSDLNARPAIESDSESAPDAELLAELNVLLQRELAAAGKGTSTTTVLPDSKVIHKVSRKTENRIGESYESPWQSTFEFVEYLKGDYDGNGRVNAADLVPLARYWGARRHPHETDNDNIDEDELGIGYGERFTRVDGNLDGLIGAGDISVIAQHWNEGLDGIRIYFSQGNEPEQLLVDNVFSSSSMTVARRFDYPDRDYESNELYTGFDFHPDGRPYGTAGYFQTIEHRVDLPFSLRIVPVLDVGQLLEGTGSTIEYAANKVPQLKYELDLVGDGIPSLASVKFEPDLENESGDSLNYSLEVLVPHDTGVRLLTTPSIKEPIQYMLTHTGEYTLRMKVTDSFGASDVSEETFQLNHSSIAIDSAWHQSSLGIAHSNNYTAKTTDLEIIDGNPALLIWDTQSNQEPEIVYGRATDASGESWPDFHSIVDYSSFIGNVSFPVILVNLFEDGDLPILSLYLGNGLGAISGGTGRAYRAEDASGTEFHQVASFDSTYFHGPGLAMGKIHMPYLNVFSGSFKILRESPGLPDGNEPLASPDYEDVADMVYPTLLEVAGQLVLLKHNMEDGTVVMLASADLQNPTWSERKTFRQPGNYAMQFAATDGTAIHLAGFHYNDSRSYLDNALMLGRIALEGDEWTYSENVHQFPVLDYRPLTSEAPSLLAQSDWTNLAVIDHKPVLFYSGSGGHYYIAALDEEGFAIGAPTRIETVEDIPWRFFEVEESQGKPVILGKDTSSGELLYIRQD